jgi:hypothetical protein
MKKVEETLFSKNKSKNEKLLEIFHQMRESKTWY